MSYKLLIVESPVKAKTIERYLGTDYKVISCNGHIRDFPKNKFAIDIENGFVPTYIIEPEKASIVQTLKSSSDSAQEVLLATDDDREGEAISWHLQQILQLDQHLPNRVFFREITQKAILKALQNPRPIDMHRVNAQQARRTLDRIVGYDISPILWKKIKPGLSAGRVQSVAVKLIVEQERAIHSFIPKSDFKVTAQLMIKKGSNIDAELSERLGSEKEASSFLQACTKAEFAIKAVKKTTSTRQPAPPFTTSTLQQEASHRLGFSVNKTMILAQQLYEQGYITYMRTDSTNLAQEALNQAKKIIIATYGQAYHTQTHYTTKAATAQQAHEAIRPTRLDSQTVSKDPGLQKLYKLIWQKTIASQMTPATIARNSATISISTSNKTLVSKTETITFKGFLAAYDYQEKALQPAIHLQEGQSLTLDHMQARESFTQPPARYTEATLVKRLEQEGIGRPSTYAPTISTIQKRGYVIKESRPGTPRKYQIFMLKKGKITQQEKEEIAGSAKHKLFPTDTALVVNDFLADHFANIINYKFTAKIEDQLDEIAQNKKPWKEMLAGFYQHFSPQVQQADQASKDTLPTLRHLGKDPTTGKPVIARLSKRYGPLVQIGGMDDEEKPRFASLPKGQFLEQITLEQALKLFQLPRKVGDLEEADIIAHTGRYGPYIKHQDKFYALGKELNPYTITQVEAINLIKAMREAEAKKIIKTFSDHPDIQLRQGRWGAYIKTPKKNVRIPQDKVPETLSLQECLTIIAQAPEPKTKLARPKKTARRKKISKE